MSQVVTNWALQVYHSRSPSPFQVLELLVLGDKMVPILFRVDLLLKC
jgi:hypothetical protein